MKLPKSEAINLKKLDNRNRNPEKILIKTKVRCWWAVQVGTIKPWKIGVDFHRPSQIDFELQVEALLIGKCLSSLSILESLAILS